MSVCFCLSLVVSVCLCLSLFVAADLAQCCKTFGFQDYRAKYGCIHCFKSKDQLKDYRTLGKKRTHDWFMQTGMEALTVHNVDEDLARDVKRVCTSKKKQAGVIF